MSLSRNDVEFLFIFALELGGLIYMIFDDEWKLQVKDKGYVISNNEFVFHTDEKTHMEKLVKLLGEQQAIIEELKIHNLQHFLEWLVIERYVTDESMKDISNVINCVNKFKEYLTDEQFETIRWELEDDE